MEENTQKLFPDTPLEEFTYEQAYTQLEQIVTSLENGEYSLDETLAMYERGQKLAEYCSKLLDQAEIKLKKIAGDKIVPFEA